MIHYPRGRFDFRFWERSREYNRAAWHVLQWNRECLLMAVFPWVLNNASETFASFLDIYERDVLPTRELAKGTLDLCAVHFRRFRKQF